MSGITDDGLDVTAAGTVGAWEATACSARIKGSGNVFPRASARRRIPAHAFELKKYCCGIESLTRTCDNEHTTASLGQSEILGVEGPPCDCPFGSKHTTSVRPFLPCRDEFIVFTGKASKEATECSAFVAKDSGNVLPHDDAGLLPSISSNSVDCIGKIHIREGQLAAGISETCAKSCHRECLAGRSTDQDVRCFDFTGQYHRGQLRHVAVIHDARKPMRENFRRVRVDFSQPRGRPAEAVPCDAGGLYPTAN